MIRAAIVSAVLAMPVAIWCQGPPEELTLERAVFLAVQNNRLVKSAALEVEKNEEALAATRTHRLPSFQLNLFANQLLTEVDFRFRRGVFGTFPATGPIPGADTTIRTPRRPIAVGVARAAQPLSQLYRIGLGVRLQELRVEAARQSLRLEQQSVANEVRKAYYGMLETQSGLEAVQAAIQLYVEVDRVVGESLVQQAALQSDNLEAKSRLAAARYEAVRLRNRLATQKEQLNRVLGRDLRTDFRVSSAADPGEYPIDLEGARARALQQRPEMKEARVKAQQAEYDRRIKKAEYIPDISLTFHYLSPFSIEVLPRNVVAGGLLLSWDLFDWGRKKRELAIKSKTVEQAKSAVEETEAQILLEVDSRYRRLEEARALLQVTELGQEAAREKVRVVLNRHTQRAVLMKDVLQSQSALAESNHHYQQALSAYWAARADLDKALGEQ